MGINCNTVPVTDVIDNSTKYTINTTRSFSNDPIVVKILAQTVIDATLNQSIIPISKHLICYGRSKDDLHHTIASINTSEEDLAKTDFIPIKGIKSKLCMVTHNIINFIDPNKISTLSKKVCTYIRMNLVPNSILVVDDIHMKGIGVDVMKYPSIVKDIFSCGYNIIISSHEIQIGIMENTNYIDDYSYIYISGLINSFKNNTLSKNEIISLKDELKNYLTN